jgi:hypothetical protein
MINPITLAGLVDHYRRAEDLSDMGLFGRGELGAALFELMSDVGETRLRRVLAESCPEISWEAADTAMHWALVIGPEFFEDSSWRNRLDSSIFAWLTNRYQQAQFLSNLGLLHRVQLGDRLLALRNLVGEARLRRTLTESEISWEDADSAMNLAVAVVDREFLEASCRPNFQSS